MPPVHNWTADEFDLIRTRRAEQKTWNSIAAELKLARQTVALFAKRNGLWTEPSIPTKPPPPNDPFLSDPYRPPLPPGHPLSWDVITAGTLLEGIPYPL